MSTANITGFEHVDDEHSPFAALVQFYRAFNEQDLQAMRVNWLQDNDASMSNPLGGLKRGWADIDRVYQKIFHGPASVSIEFYDYIITSTDTMFVAVGREKGSLVLADKTINLAIRTSRIYCRQGTDWKQVHHHGSMDDPVLLSQYQAILLN